MAKIQPESRRCPITWFYREIDDFCIDEGPPPLPGSQKIISGHSFMTDDLLVEPSWVAAFEQDEAVFCPIHDGLGFDDQLLEFHLADLSFKYRILDPVEVASTEFKHFGHPLFVDVVHGYYVHGSKLGADFPGLEDLESLLYQ